MKFDSKIIDDVEYVFPKKQKIPDSIVTRLRDSGKLSVADVIRNIIAGRQTTEGYIVDVGCNIGEVSLWMADYQGRQNKILAIDGSIGSIQCLKESIRRNNFTNLEAVHAVVSHSSFKCGFYKPPHEHSLIGNPLNFFQRIWTWNAGNYMTNTLDEIVGDRICSLIKISVEGHEPGVLSGAMETLQRDKPPLVIAYNTDQGGMSNTLDTLYELGYESFLFQPFKGNVGSQSLTLMPIISACENCGKGHLLSFPRDDPKYGFTVTGGI